MIQAGPKVGKNPGDKAHFMAFPFGISALSRQSAQRKLASCAPKAKPGPISIPVVTNSLFFRAILRHQGASVNTQPGTLPTCSSFSEAVHTTCAGYMGRIAPLEKKKVCYHRLRTGAQWERFSYLVKTVHSPMPLPTLDDLSFVVV